MENDKRKFRSMMNAPAAEPTQEPAIQVQMSADVVDSLNALQTNVQASVQGVQDALTDNANAMNGRMDELENRISNIQVVDPVQNADCGFRSMDHFLHDVRRASRERDQECIDRLNAARNYILSQNAVGSDEHAVFSDPDGGFLVPETLFQGMLTTDPFAIQEDTGTRTFQIPMGSMSVGFNARVDKNHSNSVSGGLRVYRRAEANQAASSKQNYEQIRLTATALDGVAYVTEELEMYSPQSIAALINNGFNDEWRSHLNGERIRGTGVGQFQGILNSDAKIRIAKEGSQAADTILGANVIKMRARIWGYGNSVWMVNQDTYPQLAQLHQGLTNDDNVLFVPGNGTDVPDTLLGRPVIYDENCSTLGDEGDIILVNWSQYLEGMVGGPNLASSIHVRFLEHENTYRFGVYNDAKCWWRTAMTPKNSTSTLSPIVTLANRA